MLFYIGWAWICSQNFLKYVHYNFVAKLIFIIMHFSMPKHHNWKNKTDPVCINLSAQDGDNLTKEQIAEQIRKIKEEHAEDEGIFLSI